MEQFSNYPLGDEILKAVAELGFVTPTPIQKKTIPAILDSTQDLIGLAQTGTGKTAGFGSGESDQRVGTLICRGAGAAIGRGVVAGGSGPAHSG